MLTHSPPPTIAIEGQVDDETVEALQRRLAEALTRGHARIVLDLSAVTLMSVPTLSSFCRVLRQAGRAGAMLAVAGGPPHARRTIAVCAFDGVELQQPGG